MDMIDLDNLPPVPAEMREYLALSKTAVLLERMGDALSGGCVGAALMLLAHTTGLWALVLVATLPTLTAMVFVTHFICKRRMDALSNAMTEDERP
jgi:hypothetical protein